MFVEILNYVAFIIGPTYYIFAKTHS